MKIGNDILLDGIIKYTKDNKLSWKIYFEEDLKSEYHSSLQISGIKRINIRFFCNYRKMNESGISIYITIKKNEIRQFAYFRSQQLTTNRFQELSDGINYQLKRSLIIK